MKTLTTLALLIAAAAMPATAAEWTKTGRGWSALADNGAVSIGVLGADVIVYCTAGIDANEPAGMLSDANPDGDVFKVPLERVDGQSVRLKSQKALKQVFDAKSIGLWLVVGGEERLLQFKLKQSLRAAQGAR